MADGTDGQAAGGETLDQAFAVGVLYQIPQRAMSARIKNGIKTRIADLSQDLGLSQCFWRILVGFKSLGRLGLCIFFITY